MADAPDATEKLFARAAAAMVDAQMLAARNRAWQAEVTFGMRRMIERTCFHPKSLTLYSPADFPVRATPDQPLGHDRDGQLPGERGVLWPQPSRR